MEIGTSYVQEVAQVSKSNGISAYSQAEEKSTVDYGEYSVSEIRDIPYNEAKENYEQIKDRISDLFKEDLSESENNELAVASMQLARVNYSGNEKLNETTYETMKNMEDPIDALQFSLELQINLQDYYYGKDTTASFQKALTDDSNHINKELNASQLSNINMDDFIDKMLTTFTKDYENATDPSIKEQYKDIVDAYSSFKSNYDQVVTAPYYA